MANDHVGLARQPLTWFLTLSPIGWGEGLLREWSFPNSPEDRPFNDVTNTVPGLGRWFASLHRNVGQSATDHDRLESGSQSVRQWIVERERQLDGRPGCQQHEQGGVQCLRSAALRGE